MQRAYKFSTGTLAGRAAQRALSLCAALAIFLAGAVTPAGAVQVTSLYVVVVPAADPTAAAQEAMRVELVRLTGRRSAASDPALAALIDNARQYVERERATTSGQLQVLFDEPALAAAMAATGVALWDSDRPLVWIWLPPLDAAGDQAIRTRLSQAAQERGLPITLAAASASGAVPPSTTAAAAPPVATSAAPSTPPAPSAPSAPGSAASAAGAPAATGASAAGAAPAQPAVPGPPAAAAALDAAHAAGANAALVAAFVPTQPGTLQWTLTSGDAGGQWVGSPELAIDQVADTLAAADVAINRSPVGQFVCRVSGVNDLASLVSVLDAVHAAPGVAQVDVTDVSGDQLTLQLAARGSGPQLERALAGTRLQPTGTGTEGLLEYRYVAAR